MIRASVALRSSVVLVHDVVESFLDPVGRHYDAQLPRMLDHIERLLDAARRVGVPIIFAAPGPGEGIGPREPSGAMTWGTSACDVPERLGPLSGDIVVRKPRYGAFYGSPLARVLRDLERRTVIVCGLSLAGGVETTIRDAHNQDFRSILVADACLCRPIADQGWGAVSREEVERVILSLLAERFARVATTAEICAEFASARS